MSVKSLAKQTIWYGASSIVARFLNYLLTPYLTFKFTATQYGEMSVLYSFIPFLNILFTYGMESAYFRFCNQHPKQQVQSAASVSLLISTILFSVLLLFVNSWLCKLLQLQQTEYMVMAIGIIALDTLTVIPFSVLRQQGRPIKFASLKIAGILLNIGCLYFFLSVCPKSTSPFITSWFNANWAVGYVLLANVIQSASTWLLLIPEFKQFSWKIDVRLLKQMIVYSLPLLIAGFGGMINETFDRIMLQWLAPVHSIAEAKAEAGIYSACYKLSILITLAVQAFRMGAEPFFFKQAQQSDAKLMYARIMKFFVIVLCFMFLFVSLHLDIWKQFIRNPQMWVGLSVVPILLLANMFLGIYYNLSIWYKLSDKTSAGAYITILGALFTLAFNYYLIPIYSYLACAWATFGCYGLMMVVSYAWGQKAYPIPYNIRKLITYIVFAVLLFFVQQFLKQVIASVILRTVTGLGLTGLYVWFIVQVEKKELQKIPYLQKWIRKTSA